MCRNPKGRGKGGCHGARGGREGRVDASSGRKGIGIRICGIVGSDKHECICLLLSGVCIRFVQGAVTVGADVCTSPGSPFHELNTWEGLPF